MELLHAGHVVTRESHTADEDVAATAAAVAGEAERAVEDAAEHRRREIQQTPSEAQTGDAASAPGDARERICRRLAEVSARARTRREAASAAVAEVAGRHGVQQRVHRATAAELAAEARSLGGRRIVVVEAALLRIQHGLSRSARGVDRDRDGALEQLSAAARDAFEQG